MDREHESRVAIALLGDRNEDQSFWGWLTPGVRPVSKEANKFLLASILDYQVRAETAWGNAKRLAEEILGDPAELWKVITLVSLEEWNSKRAEYSLHRFPKGHERVYTIGAKIVAQYQGDARNIWEGQSIDAALFRLLNLGVGEQISRMVVGALIDTKQLTGKSDVKVDVHVRRVLGRLLFGSEISVDHPAIALEATRRMWPENPWLLDRPLYLLGKSNCISSAPKCDSCKMHSFCNYSKG